MSRRAISLVAVFLGALVIANILVLAIWLPNRKASAAKRQDPNLTAASSAATPAPSTPNNPAPGATVRAASASTAQTADFAPERQVTSPSGNIRISYLRDRKTKMRRIALEDAHRPGMNVVLCESKGTVWVLVSPDDQWIAVNERIPAEGGSMRLYHRESDSSLRYVVTEVARTQGRTLQDTVWLNYLNATHIDPSTPRRGVTVDATGWEGDSRKLDLSLAFLPTRENPDVPEPWSCSYDVTSKQIEPTPDQPPGGSQMADGARGKQDDTQSGATQEQEVQRGVAVANPADNNEQDTNSDTAEDTEFAGEKFPATRLDEMAVPDVNESSLSDITYAINEMYARHGGEFKDKKVAREFSQFSWYKPRSGVSLDEIENEFNDLEKGNLKVLQRCRDAKIAATRRKSRLEQDERAEEETTGQKVLRGMRTWQGFGAPMPPHP